MKIILFSHSTETDCLQDLIAKQYRSADIEVIKHADFTNVSKMKLLKHLRHLSSDVFGLGLYDIRAQQRLKLWKPLALITKARRKLLIDQSGKMQRLSWPRFLLLDLHSIAIELLLAPFVLARQWLKVKDERAKIGKTEKHLEKKSDGLKLAYLRTNFWFNLKAGGSVGHTAGVISGLTESGVDVFCISTDELFGVDTNRVPIHIVYPSRLFNTFTSLSQLAYNTVFVKNSQKILSKEKPDLIYQRYSIFNYSGVTLARRLKIPFVLEFNSSEVWKKQHWSNKRSRLLPLIREIEMLNLIAADLIVVVSEPLKRDLVELGIDEEKILVNPNGINPQKFNPETIESQKTQKLKQELGINDDEVIVGFTGTFGVWHGTPQLTEAIDEILGNRLSPNIHFLLIGDGPLKPNMEKQIGHYGNVTFTGQVPYLEIQYYLAICDILVSPHNPQVDGREFFGSPTKLFEYMAMGKGIVASDLGQIGDVLEHGGTAWLVKPGDVGDLVDGVIKLVENENLRKSLGEDARKEVIKDYTWERNVERVIERLRELGLN